MVNMVKIVLVIKNVICLVEHKGPGMGMCTRDGPNVRL